ncbi:ROK family protein [Motilibacter aurantiacus]|uniref:ROK family protein n=1 Tax=Motilibacter aurantiacus TaxID=2714955 RepID=UPI00140E0472|nr:ROK family protein [Motilibacter aurantiacus]NHC44310.1 ROK family protein [Motilibacter aurantiacus]
MSNAAPFRSAASGTPGSRSAAARVAGLLRERGPLTRAQLARAAGMPKSTVAAAVAELAAEGVVRELGAEERGGRGRPGALVCLDPRRGLVVGLQLGLVHIRAAAVDVAHTVRAERDRALRPHYSAAEALPVAEQLVRETIEAAAAAPEDVLGLGLAVPLGLTDGPVEGAPGLPPSTMRPGWESVDLVEELQGRLGLPVVLDNDSNCAARGELLWGAAKGYSDVVFFKLHIGVGGAVVLDGKVRPGRSGTAGEFGHLVLDPAGPLCRCGNRGCLETYAGTTALMHDLRPWFPDGLTFDLLLERLRAGDPACRRAVADAATRVGQAAGLLCNALDPEAVVLGGPLVRAGDLVAEEVGRGLRLSCLRATADVDIVLATLDQRAGALGAAGLALSAAPLPAFPTPPLPR